MSSDPRRHAPPSASSSRPLRHPDENADVTWLDFLRTAGGTIPPEPAVSGERKRRHTGSSPERRPIPHHPAFDRRLPSERGIGAFDRRLPSERGIGGILGGSREDAIDLTSPPRQRPQIPQRTSGSTENLRGSVRASLPRPMMGTMRGSLSGRQDSSDFVLPRWQPDADVNRCPVCQTEFRFWYRKHHCRKCGRVVCAACSPHRITIPRQYIVQPPNSSDGETSPTSPASGSSFRNLGGGEVVRVCNPCVPDPWTPDTASDASTRVVGEERRVSADASQRPERYRAVPPLPPYEHGRVRPQSHQQAPIFSRSLPPGQMPAGFTFREPYNRLPPPPPPNQARLTTTRQPENNMSPFAHLSATPPQHTRPPIAPTTSAPPQPHPRREIREEDECPVCGSELPPGERVRESHIQECIASRFSSTPSSSLPAAPPHNPPRNPQIPAQTSSSLPQPSPPAPPTDPNQSRPRATSYRPRGMAVYKATEKDCMTEDGEPQECVICFEEFQPGDEMGRMECLCKFHRLCIRTWWDTKGTGSCPTHMLHE